MVFKDDTCSLVILLIFVTLHSIVFCIKLNDDAIDELVNQKLFYDNEYDYSIQRDKLIQAELEYEGRVFNYLENEKIANQYLSYLKWKEFEASKTSGFHPAKPIQTEINYILSSELYKELVFMPKGGILHSHEDHQLSRKLLFDIIWESEDFNNLYIVDPNNTDSIKKWQMNFYINPPEDDKWVKVSTSGISKEEVIKQNTLMGLMTQDATNSPADSKKRWDLINNLWDRAAYQLIANKKIKIKYLKAIYTQGLLEGVLYWETRMSLGSDCHLYELVETNECSATNGHKYLDDKKGEKEVELAIEVSRKFKEQNTFFIGHKRISYSYRKRTIEDFTEIMNAAANLYKKYPEHVLGFDAVGEEEAGYANLHYLSQYLSLGKKNGQSKVPLYQHSAETNNPIDFITSGEENDLVSTSENAYESILLRSVRVGHGSAFNKSPFLKKILKKRKIAVEICPISNQILGLVPDIRTHYGLNLYKEGIPIVIAPDDPGTFGYDSFTIDWYAIYLSWGLNLGDLKKLTRNSLEYSGMRDKEKEKALKTLKHAWKEYSLVLKKKACEQKYDSETPFFSRIFPKEGSRSMKTNVHIYGKHFESAICKIPKCKFDNDEVLATYVSNQHITCSAPSCPACNKSVSVEVALNGIHFIPTNHTFTYKHK